jgi:undecaprenyl-diphosphatase
VVPPVQQPRSGTVYRTAARTTNTRAIVALVLAFLVPPAGGVLGYSARKQIQATRQGGDGIAAAALAVGGAGTVAYLLACMAAFSGGGSGGGIRLWQAILLGIVEGLTEFLPVSSTGHLTIVEGMLGIKVDDPAVTAFTAVIQVGAIIAAIFFFAKDIWRIIRGFVVGLLRKEERGFDYRFGWCVVVGTIPVAVVGLAGKSVISGALRSLWVVALALILWSGVMIWAERIGRQDRGEESVTLKDSLIIGVMQCVALIPGVSRSGATISGGLMRGLDRASATRLSFFLGIPALTASGLFELKDALKGNSVGVGALVVGTIVSFIVGYASIAWLLRFVVHHSIVTFVWYRIGVGVLVILALAAGWLSAT